MPLFPIHTITHSPLIHMSDFNRGIMKFEGADSPLLIILSSIFILGGISALIVWALKVAYVAG